MKTVTILALFLTACGKQTVSNNNPPACACDNYPIPVGCESQCHLADAMIKSIDPQTQTATVEVQEAGKTVQEKVPVAQLPPKIEPGTRINTLLKIDRASGNSRIIRYLPQIKPPAPQP